MSFYLQKVQSRWHLLINYTTVRNDDVPMHRTHPGLVAGDVPGNMGVLFSIGNLGLPNGLSWLVGPLPSLPPSVLVPWRALCTAFTYHRASLYTITSGLPVSFASNMGLLHQIWVNFHQKPFSLSPRVFTVDNRF